MTSAAATPRGGAPDRVASWSERGATFVVFLTLGIAVGVWAAALPALKLKLGLTARDLSLALFALSIGSILSTVTTGILAPRLGTGRATGLSALVLVLTSALTPLAPSLVLFAAVAALIGIAAGALDVSVNAHAGDIEARWGGPIMSSFHGAFSIGGLIGASAGGLLAARGWSVGGQMWLPIGIAAGLNVLALPALGRGARGSSSGLGLAWPNRAAFGLCAIALFCFVLEGAMADWSAVYLATEAGSSLGLAAAGYAAFSIAMATGRLLGDRIVAGLGPRRVIVLGGALAVFGMTLAVAVPLPLPAALGFALVGIGLSNVVPVVFSAAARTGSSPAAGIAMVASIGYAGFLTGPPVIGTIASLVGLRFGLAMLVPAALVVALVGTRVGTRNT
jgi:MFS family permease